MSQIELAKALMDDRDMEAADQKLDAVSARVEDHPVLRVFFAEARGQWNRMSGGTPEADQVFTVAASEARSFGLARRAEGIERYIRRPS